MLIIRPIHHEDAAALRTFAHAALHGISNLPIHHSRLAKFLQNGINAFHIEVEAPGGEIYPFILEDSESGERLGTCTIMARVGMTKPFCTFFIENNSDGTPKCLRLRRYSKGPSELCALYLLPIQRHGGIGKLLSFSRLMFIAAHPQRFTTSLIADMRGDISLDGDNPFWDNIGARHCHCTLKEALERLDREEIQLADLPFPEVIPWQELGPEAKAAIGTTHPHTQPAFHLLTSEGLSFKQEISVIDGGPILSGNIADLLTVKESHCTPLSAIVTTLAEGGRLALLSNEEMAGFRACRSHLFLDVGGHPVIDRETAEALQLDVGMAVRYKLL